MAVAAGGADALALTGSAWINAWTLARACRGLGVQVCVPPGTPGFPLPERRDGQRVQWQFFTEEASLRAALEAAAAGDAEGRFLPEAFPAALLDDKWAFAEFLAADDGGPRGLAQWPLAALDAPSHEAATLTVGVSGSSGAAGARPRFPLLLKARHSWWRGRKLPRGWVCRDASELAARLAGLDAEGLDRAHFFLQEWLGDDGHHVLSVGGFFDAADESRNLALVTDRVASYGEGPNSSAMLVTVPDVNGLVPAAWRVLRRLGYRGPFEMEFIEASGQCRVIELNPRFWMQHGLFLAIGNGLVRRYLGLPPEGEPALDPSRGPAPPLAWIDGTWLLRGLLRGDRNVLGPWWRWCGRRGYRAVVCPSIGYLLALQTRRLLGGKP